MFIQEETPKRPEDMGTTDTGDEGGNGQGETM